jgi:MYXO-CTERM domain-containing protein
VRSALLRSSVGVGLVGAALVAACGSERPGEESLGTQASAQTCPTGTLLQGVDTSSGQGTVDWAKAKAAGVDWVIMKVTQAADYDDPGFTPNWGPAKTAGVVRGAYCFFDATVDGVTQANYFLSKMGPLDAEDLAPTLDVECPTGANNCLGYAGGTGAVPAATYRKNLLDFMNTVEAATGRKPILYTYSSFFSGTGAAGTGTNVDTTGFDAYPLWLADYSGTSCITVGVPQPWTEVHVWQYGDTGSFNGISGNVDEDHMIGSIEELTGWPGIVHESRADVNGDGLADLCGRDSGGVKCATATSGGGFGTPFAGPGWSDADGWMAPRYASTVQLADVDGDGKADACGRAAAGLLCAPSTGAGFGAAAIGGPAWSDAEGWGLPEYYATIQLADIDGDGKADACARAAAGVVCSIAGKGSGADAGAGATAFFGPQINGPAWSDAAGWNTPSRYRTIRFVDIDGDGKADVCGRGGDGIHCATSNGAGFGADIAGPTWSDASGWTAAAYASTIQFADIDGDGKADVCGRAAAGVTCAPSTGAGFGAPITGPAWSDAAGWNAPMYYSTILFLDLDGDGKSDVCGRGPNGMTCAISKGTAFGAEFAGPAWSDAQGWNQAHYYGTIRGGDIDGDGKADLCGRGAAGVTCALSTGAGFAAAVSGPTWSDATWGLAPYWATVSAIGGVKRAATTGDGGVVLSDGGVLHPPVDSEDGGNGVTLQATAQGSASGGCSCRAAGGERDTRAGALLAAAVALVFARRRRRDGSR